MDRTRTVRTTTRASEVPLGAERVWAGVAGTTGSPWYVDAAPFVFRGALDRLVGGAGRRWPVPDRELLETDDVAGFWRVVESSPPGSRPGRLLLEAQVRAPGVVRLSTSVTSRGGSRTRVSQTVTLQPSGLLGWAYLVADLGAREAVVELTHRRVLAGLD